MGDANNEANAGACGDSNQSVEVAKASPALSHPATVGEPIGDTATLAGAYAPGGQITFSLHGPGDRDCTAPPVFSDTKPVSANGPHSSESFTPKEAGTYRWVASYSGDANNHQRSGGCGDPGQTTQVFNKAPQVRILAVELDRKRGSAELSVSVNRDGTVRVAQTKRIRGTAPTDVGDDHEAVVEVKTRGKAKRRLRKRGELEVNPRVLFETADANKTASVVSSRRLDTRSLSA